MNLGCRHFSEGVPVSCRNSWYHDCNNHVINITVAQDTVPLLGT